MPLNYSKWDNLEVSQLNDTICRCRYNLPRFDGD